MGNTRQKPARLAEKLRQIRNSLELSPNELVRRLGVEDQIDNAGISAYETGLREPTLMILLQYARLANVYMEALVDDDLDLPTNIPAPTKTEGIRRKQPTRKNR